jgi:dolichol-phosphate mannosyltransferase
VIPAFNAGASLAPLLETIRSTMPGVVVVGVDDGSTDDTRVVIQRGCERAITFDTNRGKGAALRAGFEAALSIGAQVVLTIDADGQHDVASAPRLIDALCHADIVVGARRRIGSTMPLHRRMSNALSSAAISAVARHSLRDTQSGYRAIRRDVLERVTAAGDRYEFETDFLIQAARRGFRIASVDVPTLYGPSSHFRPFGDTLLVAATIWRHRAGVLP